jgi:hypothetical protein
VTFQAFTIYCSITLPKLISVLKTNWVEDMKQGNHSIGAALILVLAEAGDPQKKVAVADMQFNHIEVELGPIPALRLKYKNDGAIKHYIHKE